jgi:hypothetical protein
MHIVSFTLNKEKIISIYKDTSVIFETNQIGKDEAFVLIMNHLSVSDESVGYYIGKVRINTKTSFESQNCLVDPITFLNG